MNPDSHDACPIACTLEAQDYKQRLALIADLNRDALLAHRRDGLRLQLTYASHAEGRVRDIVRRERNCCAFLSFEVRVDGDAVQVVIEVPESARIAAESVFEPFRPTGAADSPQRARAAR